MASFQAKIGRKRMRKRENKNYSFLPSLLDGELKIPKKFKKLNNTVMAPFRAKIGGKTMRKGQNKNYHFVPFRSGAEQKTPKKKAKKLKK